jgi:uncharacterized protein YjbI with pentapeptide repeats
LVGRWDWLGVGERRWTKTADEELRPAKTAWDWLQLAVVPLVLAAIALAFNASQASRDRARDEQRVREDRAAAVQRVSEDRALAAAARREEALQAYLTRMAELMLDRDLLRSKESSEVREVARAITLATLRRLNGDGRGQVVRFLAEAGLIGATPFPSWRNQPAWTSGERPVVELRDADLRGAVLVDADLAGSVFSGAHLVDARLRGADLRWTTFEGAELRGADLDGAKLGNAELADSRLEDASFRGASLQHAGFVGACLTRVSFVRANLTNVSFFLATGAGIDFTEANLKGWDLSGASLSQLTLDRAKFDPRTLPDDWSPTGSPDEDSECLITNKPRRLP